MVHPAGDDLARMNVIAVQELDRHLHRGRPPTRPPSRTAGATPSTPRCSATSTSPPCGSTSCPTSASTACSSRRGRSRTSSPPAPSPSGWCAPRASPPSSRSRRGWPRASRPAPPRPAARSSIAWKPVVYADMLDNEAMVALYAANAEPLGRPVAEPHGDVAVVGSTDMGNVSYLVPSIHPMIAAAPSGLPDPHARVRQPRPVRVRRPGGGRRRRRAGLDGRRPVARRRRPRGRAGRVRRHHRAGGARGASGPRSRWWAAPNLRIPPASRTRR